MYDILILEDDFELAKSWEAALKEEGGMVVIARSSNEALRHLEERQFHTVIVDLMIEAPEGESDSGVHFLRELHNLEPPLPNLIGVSGYYGSDDGEMAKKLLRVYGVQHVLLKPFDPVDLIKLI